MTIRQRYPSTVNSARFIRDLELVFSSHIPLLAVLPQNRTINWSPNFRISLLNPRRSTDNRLNWIESFIGQIPRYIRIVFVSRDSTFFGAGWLPALLFPTTNPTCCRFMHIWSCEENSAGIFFTPPNECWAGFGRAVCVCVSVSN